ncbi:hypothetical protein EZS27_026653 [termite gut metagenome]|uniref:Uncharacterized protein n=1 Tax=termite gut metagenome TaxID=433724 RepID=A0A5J4QSN0_9ZZZZ
MPVIEEGDVFKLTIRYEKERKTNVDVSEKINNSAGNEDKILALIRENPRITAYILMNRLSLSERGVRKILAHLVELRRIERKGSRKDGEWIIIQN